MRTAAESLEQHGFTAAQLLGIARDVASDRCQSLPYASPQLREDLVSFLVEQGCLLAVRYDPDRVKPGYTFASYLWDVLAYRVTDFFRRKSEGFGDKRYASNNRVTLFADPLEGHESDVTLDDPFEPRTAREAAIELAHQLGLSPESEWALVELAGRLADGCSSWTRAADETGIRRREGRTLLENLRAELEQRGYDDGDGDERLSAASDRLEERLSA